jgi:hypothetical protein
VDDAFLQHVIEKVVEKAARRSDDESAFYTLLAGSVAKLNADIDSRFYDVEVSKKPDLPPDGPLYNFFWEPIPTVLLFKAVQKYHRCTWDEFLKRIPPVVEATSGGCFKTKGDGLNT